MAALTLSLTTTDETLLLLLMAMQIRRLNNFSSFSLLIDRSNDSKMTVRYINPAAA